MDPGSSRGLGRFSPTGVQNRLGWIGRAPTGGNDRVSAVRRAPKLIKSPSGHFRPPRWRLRWLPDDLPPLELESALPQRGLISGFGAPHARRLTALICALGWVGRQTNSVGHADGCFGLDHHHEPCELGVDNYSEPPDHRPPGDLRLAECPGQLQERLGDPCSPELQSRPARTPLVQEVLSSESASALSAATNASIGGSTRPAPI